MAAVISLTNECKTEMGSALKTKIKYVSLLKITRTSLNNAILNNNDLAGLKEKHEIQYLAGANPVKSKNDLTNTPLLVFSIKKTETAYSYIFTEKVGSDYYEKMIITRGGSPQAESDDTVKVLKDFQVGFKGNGEA